MWIDTTPFPPCKPNLKKKSALPPWCGGGAGGRGLGRPQCPRRELGSPGASPPPGAEGLCTFLRREKGLRLFFSIFYSLDKQTSRSRRFGACPRGSIGGLGEGRGLCSIPNENANSLHQPCSLPEGLSGSEGTPGPREAPPCRAPRVQPRRTPAAAKGPRNDKEPEGCRGGPGLPAPAQPVPGSDSFINQRLGERAAL